MPRALLVSLWIVSAALAFQATGRISGTVEDPAGRPVAGARVTLALADSAAAAASTVTGARGAFLLPALAPGLYDLTVEAAGFPKLTVRNVQVSPAAETALADIHLGPDELTSSSNRAMSEVPLLRRDPEYAAETLPGVSTNGRAPLAFYGESAALANRDYDGVNTGGRLPLRVDQTSGLTVTTGVIEEGCGCSQLSFAVPRGGPAFHGSAYWLVAPAATAAETWADNAGNTPAVTRFNQLGASLGGPLIKNRLFFFVNYEADLDRSAITRTGAAPTAPLTSRDPLLQQVLALIPSSPSGIYRGQQSDGGTTQQALLRLDYFASPRHNFSLTAAGTSGTLDDPADSSVFGATPTTTIGVSAPFYSAVWRWSPSAHLTNEVRAGASLENLDFRNSLRARFGFVAILDDPSVSVSQPMAGLDPERRGDHLYGYQDNLTWVKGRHTVKAGLWFQQYRLDSDGFNRGPLDSLTVPRYTVSDIADGTISQVDQRFNIASPASGYSGAAPARSRLAADMISPYIHDDWRLFPSLTVSFGLRYDYLSRASERTGSAIIPALATLGANAVYDQNLPFAFVSASQPFYRKDLDNYDPYVGLAWKPSTKLPVVVRGGFNIAYLNDDLLPNLSIYALENPFQSFNVTTALGGVPLSKAPATLAPTLPASLTVASLAAFAASYNQQPGTVYAVDWNIRTPNVKYWNIGVESDLKGLHVDVGYLGNRLEEAPRSVDRNQTMLSPAFLAAFAQVQAALKSGAPSSGFPGLLGGGLCSNFNLANCQPDLYARSLILTGQAGELGRWYQGQGYNAAGAYSFLGNPLTPQGIDLLAQLGVSRFDGLQARAMGQVAAGFYFAASYLFSKTLSNLDDYQPGAIDPNANLYNQALEWAPSPFNLTHAFKATVIWDVPAARRGRLLSGWSVSAIAIAQSGAPFSLLSGLGTFTSAANSGQNTVTTSLTASEIRQFFGIRKGPGATVAYVTAPAGAFAEPAPGALGTLQRRTFSGPAAFNLNLGVRKSVALAERVRAEFRADAINALNRVNWLVGDQTYLGGAFNNNVTQWNPPRTFQFSLRALF
jgi:hypothetical protein